MTTTKKPRTKSKEAREKKLKMTEEFKWKVMEDYFNRVPTAVILKKWGIGRSYLYRIKATHGDAYLQTKNKVPKVVEAGEVPTIYRKTENVNDYTAEIVMLKNDIMEALRKTVLVADIKLTKELERLQGGGKEQLPMKDVTGWYSAIAPYVLVTVGDEAPEDGKGNTVANKHRYIMQLIQNQQVNNFKDDGYKENTVAGDQQG